MATSAFRRNQIIQAKMAAPSYKKKVIFSTHKEGDPVVRWLPWMSPNELLARNETLWRDYSQALDHCLSREDILSRMQWRVGVTYEVPQRILDLKKETTDEISDTTDEEDDIDIANRKPTQEDMIDAGYIPKSNNWRREEQLAQKSQLDYQESILNPHAR